MKSQVLYMVKAQLEQAVRNLNYDNMQETVDVFANCFAMLEATGQLPDLEIKEEKVEEPATPAERSEAVEEEREEPQDESVKEVPQDTSNRRGPFRFERKFKGGFIPEAEAFVPEKTVRDLDLRHGDLVYASLLKERDNGPDIYSYQIAQRKNEKEPIDRLQINYAIVEMDPSLNRYVCSKTADGKLIKLDEVPYTIILPEEDVNELSIKHGDVIDVVLSKNNPTYVRILWRYSTDEIEESRSPRPSSYYKAKEGGSTEDVKEVFKGKTICVMGYEPGKEALRTEVEKRGGEFLWLSGRETATTLSATMNKADAVVLMLGHVGHAGTIFAVDHCKRTGIPCGSTHGFGRSSFVVKAEELLTETK